MGRGRAKAKQTKVARKLKYYSPETDLTALERELRSGESGPTYVAASSPEPVEEDDDDYRYSAYDDDEDTPGSWAAGGH
ncbi:DUF3073 domain-containing protein [Ornithinimicrobium sp. Arc0846-15]|nr:DUF3073 domain-containing protein [Ornithinimicrobium laminariae]